MGPEAFVPPHVRGVWAVRAHGVTPDTIGSTRTKHCLRVPLCPKNDEGVQISGVMPPCLRVRCWCLPVPLGQTRTVSGGRWTRLVSASDSATLRQIAPDSHPGPPNAGGSPMTPSTLCISTSSNEARQLLRHGRDHAHHYEFEASREILDRDLALDPSFLLALLHRCDGTEDDETAPGSLAPTPRGATPPPPRDASPTPSAPSCSTTTPRAPSRSSDPLPGNSRATPIAPLTSGSGTWGPSSGTAKPLAVPGAAGPGRVLRPGLRLARQLRPSRRGLRAAGARLLRYLELAPDHPRAYDSRGLLALERGKRRKPWVGSSVPSRWSRASRSPESTSPRPGGGPRSVHPRHGEAR